MFKPVQTQVDFIAQEHEMLDFWDKIQAFQKLNHLRQGAPRWSFIDGPITANNPMGVHHAWGRTYKDLYQRYHTMLGHRQRYQNGFDCQGLWVEVEVEKELGLGNKREIEAYGVDRICDDLTGLLDHLGEASAIFAGLDFGAFAIYDLALRDPGRVRAVIGLENPAAPHNPDVPPLAEYAAMAKQHFVHIEYFREPGPADASEVSSYMGVGGLFLPAIFPYDNCDCHRVFHGKNSRKCERVHIRFGRLVFRSIPAAAGVTR